MNNYIKKANNNSIDIKKKKKIYEWIITDINSDRVKNKMDAPGGISQLIQTFVILI